jgi:hypothetical protein
MDGMVRGARWQGDRDFGEGLLPLRSKAPPISGPRALLTLSEEQCAR